MGSGSECSPEDLSLPYAYGAKIKGLLLGEPLSAQELTRLDADPAALEALVETWFDRPDSERALLRFFAMAFQQDQVDVEGLRNLIGVNTKVWGVLESPRQRADELMIRNMEQSFARTALRLVREGQPFSEVAVVDALEMTTALMVLYAYLDQNPRQDDGRTPGQVPAGVTEFTLLRDEADEASAEDILDPGSPHFMEFWHPRFRNICAPPSQDRVTLPTSVVEDVPRFIFQMMFGRATNIDNNAASPTGRGCAGNQGRHKVMLSRRDFEDWRTVQIERVPEGRARTSFFALAQLREQNTLDVSDVRGGFFTTPGFLATWPSNEDNSMRVSLNQTLITALGASFSGQAIVDFSPPGLDEEHSAPNTSCYGCHQTLDPMRDYFRTTVSYFYGRQRNEEARALVPQFRFRGVAGAGAGLEDFGRILSTHPDLPRGWAQKLCFLANGEACDETSRGFQEAITAYRENDSSFRSLLVSVYSSPIVTNRTCTTGAPVQPLVARVAQFCSALSVRLGLERVCGTDVVTSESSRVQRVVERSLSGLPTDIVSRGDVDHVVISDTSLFTRATREVICEDIANLALDPVLRPLSRTEALTFLVDRVVGLPEGDPRRDSVENIIQEHVEEVMSSGAPEATALRSAFVLACMSPSLA
ncbi:MAG: hypothetical protein AAFU79_15480, partial [Myxococcota bacterium]